MSDYIARYLAGESVESLAAEMGVSPTTIWRRLKAAKVEMRSRPDKVRAHGLLPDDVLWRRLHYGETVAALARECGLDDKVLAERAARIGARTPSQRIIDLGVEAGQLYDSGLTLREVGAQMGAHPRTVRSWLTRTGHPLRPQGTRPTFRG